MLVERTHGATTRQLRQFAGALIVATLILLLRVWWRHGAVGPVAATLSMAALVCGVAGLARPRSIAWLFQALTAVTWPIGVVVSELMLAVLYFVVVTPVAFAVRLSRRDRLGRRGDAHARTYWIESRRADDPSRYFRQS